MQNNKDLKISIVTPVLNREKYIEELISSIRAQDYPFIEHIVADGGSTDNTLNVLKKYEGTYDLKWFSGKDKGIADAYNKGFAQATGDIFCWQDSDDLYLPGTIKKVVEVFKNNPEIDFVFGDILYCDENGKIVDYAKRYGYDKEALLYNGMNINPQTAFWRSSLYKKLNGLNTNYKMCADYDFYLRASEAGAKFYHIPKFLAMYRLHKNQITSDKSFLLAEAESIRRKFISKDITDIKLKKIKKKLFFKRIWGYIKTGNFIYIFRSVIKRFEAKI